MAYTIVYPRNSYYQSPYCYSSSRYSPLPLASTNPWFDVYDDLFCNYYHPYQYKIVGLIPAERQRSAPKQCNKACKDAASKECCNTEKSSQSQSASKKEDETVKEPNLSKPSSRENTSKTDKSKKSTAKKVIAPWFSLLNDRPWYTFADIFGEATSDDCSACPEEYCQTSDDNSSLANHPQDIVTSRSHTESRTQSNGKDKYAYCKSSFKKKNGESKTVITQTIGDQKHTVTTIVDAEGNECQSEDYINVEEDQIEEFKESLKKFQCGQVCNSTCQKLCDEAAASNEAESKKESDKE
ncbi:expressed hypothetical protein [Trichoplax adhaerens]|uniref:Uncharacterized protein n=1 Tax=Trichoplax adhaerens TaxID=10228 RepID=B3RK92_TRIAD|nr:expressed hypothetical protein [Trichoplax adhaerens]EDV29886.1 expressed hypothetical protein [Trichoplax adhaerens]|eukprot:XP_002109088.1 expressed hypothetical protein [Trichoplax adhaerens]